MASDWLATVLPANQMPGLKIFENDMDFHMEISSCLFSLPILSMRLSHSQHDICSRELLVLE